MSKDPTNKSIECKKCKKPPRGLMQDYDGGTYHVDCLLNTPHLSASKEECTCNFTSETAREIGHYKGCPNENEKTWWQENKKEEKLACCRAEKGWEEEFAERFSELCLPDGGGNYGFSVCSLNVKSFIYKEIEKAYKEGVEDGKNGMDDVNEVAYESGKIQGVASYKDFIREKVKALKRPLWSEDNNQYLENIQHENTLNAVLKIIDEGNK